MSNIKLVKGSDMTGSFNAKDAAMVRKLTDVLDAFRQINQDVTANQIIAFLTIAVRPGITQRELIEATGLADGTVSRLVAVLSDRGVQGREGLGLIEIGMQAGDYRTRHQSLSPKGKRLFASVTAIMAGSK